MLRDRVARALPAWSPETPGYHAVLGMHAFGLEETGLYDRAERLGRRAVELEPRDGWAQHAVAHVLEMQGRVEEGIGWMRANPDAWSRESFFCRHNWWHLALYHLEIGDVDEVWRLYDGPIYGRRSGVVLDMVDASSLLWRLSLRGIDAGLRWAPLADAWEVVAAAGSYAFNDAHAMMAFVRAGRPRSVQAVLEAQARAIVEPGDNAAFTREVGAPVTRAILAFGEGRYGDAVQRAVPLVVEGVEAHGRPGRLDAAVRLAEVRAAHRHLHEDVGVVGVQRLGTVEMPPPRSFSSHRSHAWRLQSLKWASERPAAAPPPSGWTPSPRASPWAGSRSVPAAPRSLARVGRRAPPRARCGTARTGASRPRARRGRGTRA